MNKGDLRRLKVEYFSEYKEDEGEGQPGGQLFRTPLVPFDENSHPLKLRPDAPDFVPVASEARFHRVSLTDRTPGDLKLKGSLAMMSVEERGSWGPSVFKPSGVLQYLVQGTFRLWLHEAIKYGSQHIAHLYNQAMEMEEFSEAATYLQMVEARRKKKGTHTEQCYGLEPGDNEEGFPFLADTFLLAYRGLAEMAMGTGDGEGAEMEGVSGELRVVQECEKKLLAMAGWVFAQCAADLRKKAELLDLLQDDRVRRTIILYQSCGSKESPSKQQIRAVMAQWASAVALRKRRNSDGGHPFLIPLNPVDVVKERVECLGEELRSLPKAFEGYTNLANHAWLCLNHMLKDHPGTEMEAKQAEVTTEELADIIKGMTRSNPFERSSTESTKKGATSSELEAVAITSHDRVALVDDKKLVDIQQKELKATVTTMMSKEVPVDEVIAYVENGKKELSLPATDVLLDLWDAMMDAVQWGGKNTSMALRQVRGWGKLLCSFSSTSKAEVALIYKVQACCYEDAKLRKLFPQLVRILYESDVLAEDTILTWYRKGTNPKGRQAFVKALEPFVKWLEEAEEDDDE